jgi:hypothetical protein
MKLKRKPKWADGVFGPEQKTIGQQLGMAIRLRILDTHHDGYWYGDNFLSASDIRTRLESRRVWNGYFFPPAGNPTGIRYFTTAIILCCEQVKMCSFCYINYDLF